MVILTAALRRLPSACLSLSQCAACDTSALRRCLHPCTTCMIVNVCFACNVLYVMPCHQRGMSALSGYSADVYRIWLLFLSCHVCLARVTSVPQSALSDGAPSSVPPNALSNGILPFPTDFVGPSPYRRRSALRSYLTPPALHLFALRVCLPIVGSSVACALS